MLITIKNSNTFPHQKNVEIVECKGVGHPDSLVCQIAESVCLGISNFHRKKYKIIPRFNIDQVEINGGEIEVKFRKNKLITPGRISITGKVACFLPGDMELINKIVVEETKKILRATFDESIFKFFVIKANINRYLGNNKLFFENQKIPLSEDTSLGIGFYPYTEIEKLTLATNNQLFEMSKHFPVGKDTKVMVFRKAKKIQIIISIAFLSNKIKNIEEYFLIERNMGLKLKKFLSNKIKTKFQLVINAADDIKTNKFYITATGTAAEHDKGSLGRGNGLSGLITPYRPSSFEVVYGKNPVYNVSKLYNILAYHLAKKISKLIKNNNYIEIEILSRIGNPINAPQIIDIKTSRKTSKNNNIKIKNIIENEFDKLFKIFPGTNFTILTDKIIKNKKL